VCSRFDFMAECKEGPAAERGRELIGRMTQHSFKVLNLEMDSFLESQIDVFDQDPDDFASGRGETLEQYDSYQKYVSELEQHFDAFAAEEGFTSSKECFEFIERAVSEDMVRQKKQMRKLQRQLNKLQKQWETAAIESQVERKSKKEIAAELKAEHPLIGKAVVLHGLSREEMNGMNGTVEGWDKYAERYIVRLATKDGSKGKGVKIKKVNIKEVPKLEDGDAKAEGKAADVRDEEGGGVGVGSEGKRGEDEGKEGTAAAATGAADDERAADAEGDAKAEAKDSAAADQEAAIVAARDGGVDEDDESDLEDDMDPDKPMVLFCQPISLESLVQSVLQISEYQTYSMIMRMKVRQTMALRKIKDQIARRSEEKEARKEDLEAFRNVGDKGHFGSLRQRICDLTPNRRDLIRQAEEGLPGEVWDQLLQAGNLITGDAKNFAQALIKFLFDRLNMLCSPVHEEGIRLDRRDLEDMVWSATLEEFVGRFLEDGHRHLDAIQDATAEAFLAQAKAVDEMKKKMIRESIAAHEASRGGGGRSQNGPAVEEITEAKGGDEDAK